MQLLPGGHIHRDSLKIIQRRLAFVPAREMVKGQGLFDRSRRIILGIDPQSGELGGTRTVNLGQTLLDPVFNFKDTNLLPDRVYSGIAEIDAGQVVSLLVHVELTTSIYRPLTWTGPLASAHNGDARNLPWAAIIRLAGSMS